jgi:hypothetical protein
MRVRVAVVFSVLLVLAPRAASAQMYETVGIRAQGLGGAFVAVADDATATWWNPAGLASGPFFDALIEYGRIRTSPQTTVRGVATAFPSLGVSYYRLPINPLGDEHLNIVGLTFGQSLNEHVVVASTLKLERAGETHGDLDLGALARFGVAQVGISVKNVRGATFETPAGSLVLDRQARAGLALLGRSKGWIQEMTIAADADLTTTSSMGGADTRHIAGGVEVWILKKRLGLRGGGSGNTVGAKGSSASGGVSLAIRSGTYLEAHHTNGTDATRKSWGIALRSTF